MNHYRLATAAIGLGLLSGCGVFEPFPTTPLAASPGEPAGQRVAMCYNTLTASLEEIHAAAQQECPANTSAEPVDTDYHVQTCPLLIPGRATFVCKPTK